MPEPHDPQQPSDRAARYGIDPTDPDAAGLLALADQLDAEPLPQWALDVLALYETDPAAAVEELRQTRHDLDARVAARDLTED